MSEDTYEVLTALKEQVVLLKNLRDELLRVNEKLDQLIKKDHAGSAYQWTPEGLPICPKHGEAMNRREKQGDVWYSHTVTDEYGEVHYCRGYASKSSPGWEVESVNGKQETPQDYIDGVDLQDTRLPAVQGSPNDDFEEIARQSRPRAQPIRPEVGSELNEHFGPRGETPKEQAKPAEPPQQLAEPEARKQFYARGGDAVKNNLLEPQRFNAFMDTGKAEGWNKALALLNAHVESVVNGGDPNEIPF